MEIVDLTLVVHPGLVGTIRKYRAQAVHRLALPHAHLVWMNLVPGRDRRDNDSLDLFPILLTLDRPVAPQRFQRHLRLEARREPASCRHLVSLRQSVEYTLATCPIFRDQLIVQ